MTHGNERIGGRVVWVAVLLTATYIAIHLPMLYRSLTEWGRLLGALVGQ